jgi:hypothetical protein
VAVSVTPPAFLSRGLSDDEQSLVNRLNNRRTTLLPQLQLMDAYYNGNQLIRDLGISIPPQVRGLHTVVGWPQIAVDSLDERLDVEGFRYASSSDGDDELWNIWQANNLDEESQLAHLDALIYGCAYASVGTNDDGSPLVTVESARDMSVLWDPRWREITAALRVYGGDEFGRHLQATLYLPNATVMLEQGSVDGWDVVERDDHRLGVVPVARLANRQRVSDRDGRSEITAQVMSITDAACRTLLGMEVAREFYAAPQRYILGASESAFVAADGSAKTAWETYLGRVLALERDEDGNVPSVGQFTPYDPSAYTKIMDVYSEQFSAVSKLPAHMLGKTSQNPASADAIRSAENGLVKRAERRQKSFSGGWETVMRLALRMSNGGALPDEAKNIETLWAKASTPTPAATTDSVMKQVAGGAIPATSDVTREQLGYSVIERQRLKIDDQTSGTEELLAQVAHSFIAKDARTDKTIARDLNGGTGGKPSPTLPNVAQ